MRASRGVENKGKTVKRGEKLKAWVKKVKRKVNKADGKENRRKKESMREKGTI